MAEKVVIGDAILYRGDCLEIMPTLPKVDAVITDPPYGISLIPPRGLTEAIANDGRSDAQAIWAAFVPLALERSKDDSAHLFWSGWSEVWTKQVLERHATVKSCVVWAKNMWGIGYYTRPQHEMAWYVHKGRPPLPAEADSDLWQCQKVQAPIHSCEKPVALLARSIRLCDHSGSGTVLDPFMGSGTTGVACAQLGRKFIGIEIEPKYFDIACKRIEDAQRQAPLIPHETPKQVQESLLDDYERVERAERQQAQS
jgi:DNA modification methylase